MILTPSIFNGLYKLKLNEVQVMNAILTANKNLVKLLKRKEEFIIQTPKDNEVVHFGYWYPLSNDLSIELKPEDFEIFEYDVDYNQYDLSDKITSVETLELPKDTIVKLGYSEKLPTAEGRQLVLRFKKARINCMDEDLVDNIRRWLALQTFNILNKDILLYLRQKGISTWNLNGVSVSVDVGPFNELKEANEEEMTDIYNRFMPMVISRTKTNNKWLGRRL